MREEKKAVAKSLGEALKENRIRCQMTQEFAAETLGVSRQSVSTWENGFSDLNTSNLIALAKAVGVESVVVADPFDTKNFEEIVAMDVEYIDNWSLKEDIKILFKTVGVVLKGKGAS